MDEALAYALGKVFRAFEHASALGIGHCFGLLRVGDRLADFVDNARLRRIRIELEPIRQRRQLCGRNWSVKREALRERGQSIVVRRLVEDKALGKRR